MGFSISLHSSERRSLIYWRMPGLLINAPLGVSFWQTKSEQGKLLTF